MNNLILIDPEDRADYRSSLEILKKAVRRGRIDTAECAFVMSFMWGQMYEFMHSDSILTEAVENLENAFDQLSSALEGLENDTK
jgi:hypothetical protein